MWHGALGRGERLSSAGERPSVLGRSQEGWGSGSRPSFTKHVIFNYRKERVPFSLHGSHHPQLQAAPHLAQSPVDRIDS